VLGVALLVICTVFGVVYTRLIGEYIIRISAYIERKLHEFRIRA
jgi:hypothetical protein